MNDCPAAAATGAPVSDALMQVVEIISIIILLQNCLADYQYHLVIFSVRIVDAMHARMQALYISGIFQYLIVLEGWMGCMRTCHMRVLLPVPRYLFSSDIRPWAAARISIILFFFTATPPPMCVCRYTPAR